MSTRPVKGDYFIKVNSKRTDEEASYLLNYYYYEKEEMLPYRLINLQSSDITYTLASDSITFSVRPIFARDISNSPIQSYTVEYRFYFSNSKNSITKFSNCRLDSVIIKAPTSTNKEAIQFTLKVHSFSI